MSNVDNTPKASIPYENNPFTIAVNGLRLFFQLALPVAIITIVISIAGLFSNVGQEFAAPNASTPPSSNTSSVDEALKEFRNEASIAKQNIQRAFEDNLPAVVLSITAAVAIFVLFSTILSSIFDYTAAHLSNNKKVTFTDALATSLREFFPYLWLRILVSLKIFLWSLLFIVPGIIMSVRYSLAGVSFYDKSLGANAATKDSSRLVKGAWLTTNGSFSLFNIITLGVIQSVLQPGTSAILYRQLNAYDKAKQPKPDAHILSWLALIIPYVLLALFLVIVIAIFFILLQQFS